VILCYLFFGLLISLIGEALVAGHFEEVDVVMLVDGDGADPLHQKVKEPWSDLVSIQVDGSDGLGAS